MKVRIFQPIVPEYRVALFNGLGKRYSENIEVWASEGWGQDKSYPLQSIRYDYNHPFVKFGPLRWQRGLSLSGLKKGDVVVICGDVHQLSSLWIAAKAKLLGIAVVWWGHHVSVGSKALGVKIRLLLMKWLCDVALCYTKQGIEWFNQRKWQSPVFATGNTIDTNAVKQAIAKWGSERLQVFQRENGLLNHEVVVFCSVLRWKTHFEQLLSAMASEGLKLRGTKLVVIGDGEGRTLWEQQAKEFGVADRIIWIGALREQEKIAPWFLSAKVYVYPGPIGLSLIHAFAYGLPVVCHENAADHGPEFEAMTDKKTGYVFRENDALDCARQIVRLLDNEDLRCEMSHYVQELAYSRYGIESMVNNYCEAVDKAAAISKGE